MKKIIKKLFALTDQGTKALIQAGFTSFVFYIINMMPMAFLLLFLNHILNNVVQPNWIYLSATAIITILLTISLFIEYDKLFTTTYNESENLRIESIDLISNLPLSFFSKHNLTDLSQTIMADVATIEHAISHAIPKVIAFVLFMIVISPMLIISNYILGLLIIGSVLLSFLLVILSRKIVLYENKRYFDKLRDNSDKFQQAIELQQEIKSFNLEDIERKDLYKSMEEAEKIHYKAEFIGIFPMQIASIIMHVSVGMTIIVGIYLFKNNSIDMIYLLGYILASMKIKEVTEAIELNLAELFYIDSRIKTIKDLRKTKIQKGQDTQLDSYDIEFKDVSFSYKDDLNVIDSVSFSAKQNQITALIGPSGCGKSTILRLVSRLYDYDKGSITIGSKDIKYISTKSLFDKISIVFQEVLLFNSSVLENIRIGRKDASDEEVIEAAKMANCMEFIQRLPDGINTLIGENGSNLSGGERQRLSIARAFLKNAPIIILDEISASLDVENEKKIQESLNSLIKNKTVIIISHRLKSIENVDKIVILNNGKVEATGTHNELLESSKTYCNLIEKTKLAEGFKY